MLGEVPGPFRLDYSIIGGKDVLLDDRTAEVAEVIERIVLPMGLRPGSLDIKDPVQMTRWRKRVTDVQHLIAHAMAGHDLFVATDSDDILSKQANLRREAGIEVADPGVALLRVRASAGHPSGTEPVVPATPFLPSRHASARARAADWVALSSGKPRLAPSSPTFCHRGWTRQNSRGCVRSPLSWTTTHRKDRFTPW